MIKKHSESIIDFVKMFGASFVLVISMISFAVDANADTSGTRPKLIIPAEVTVKGETITIGDIGTIYNKEASYDELVNQLKQVYLSDAPKPNASENILGANILAAISKSGIETDSIGYSIPNVVVVRRLGRTVAADELLQVIRRKILSESNMDVQVREISIGHDIVIPVGASEIEVELMGEPTAGRLPFRSDVTVEGKPAARFLATAIVDDWREVPVLNKTLDRGMIISNEDLSIVRLNLFKLPADVVGKKESLLGRRVKNTIPAGETVRRRAIEIPPIIAKGKRVMAFVDKGLLRASASVVAMEDGHEDGTIRVRNENSKKVFQAVVINENEVRIDIP